MEIKERFTLDNRYILKIEGNIYNNSARVFRKKVEKILNENWKQVELDLSEVNAITSIGLKAIIFLEKEITRRGGKLNILNPSPLVSELLHMARLAMVYKYPLIV